MKQREEIKEPPRPDVPIGDPANQGDQMPSELPGRDDQADPRHLGFDATTGDEGGEGVFPHPSDQQ